jgi:hypothetical protein
MSDGKLRFRRARRQDVPTIARLPASDPLGATHAGMRLLLSDAQGRSDG